MRQYQAYPYMPSSKHDGKPFTDAAGKPVVLHSKEEEDAFRAEHPDDVADRSDPVLPHPGNLDEALAQNEELRRENAGLKAQLAPPPGPAEQPDPAGEADKKAQLAPPPGPAEQPDPAGEADKKAKPKGK